MNWSVIVATEFLITEPKAIILLSKVNARVNDYEMRFLKTIMIHVCVAEHKNSTFEINDLL